MPPKCTKLDLKTCGVKRAALQVEWRFALKRLQEAPLLEPGGTFRSPRACSSRVILSLNEKTSFAAAPTREGRACLSFKGRLHHAWRRSYVVFGGLPSLKQTERRMLTSVIALDLGVNPQQEGDP